MATQTMAVPTKDLRQWHSPEYRQDVIHDLIHGVGELLLPG